MATADDNDVKWIYVEEQCALKWKHDARMTETNVSGWNRSGHDGERRGQWQDRGGCRASEGMEGCKREGRVVLWYVAWFGR
jgi:hypothetical protein